MREKEEEGHSCKVKNTRRSLRGLTEYCVFGGIASRLVIPQSVGHVCGKEWHPAVVFSDG